MNYSMPAEWEPHEATWLAWPHNKEHWPGNFGPIPGIFAKLALMIAESEKVFICVNHEKMELEARRVILSLSKDDISNIHFFHIRTNSSWMRDIGPIFVKPKNLNNLQSTTYNLTITNWVFNCWGEKYPPWDLDDKVPVRIAEALKMPMEEPGMVLEGGSIEVNGKGTLLTTEQCLLNKNRNPHLSRAQIEEKLKMYLGAKNVLWLKAGLVGDETDGHIDEVARFVDECTILACVEENPKDENYKILQRNLKDLKKMKDQDGAPFRIIELPMPDPVYFQNQRLPVSYANFYIANTVVIVPTFRSQKDKKALEILQKLFPKRTVKGLDCVDFAWGLGAFHCSTQQQPKSPLSR